MRLKVNDISSGILLDNKSEKEINVWNFASKRGFKI